jgi:hypothetical protein
MHDSEEIDTSKRGITVEKNPESGTAKFNWYNLVSSQQTLDAFFSAIFQPFNSILGYSTTHAATQHEDDKKLHSLIKAAQLVKYGRDHEGDTGTNAHLNGKLFTHNYNADASERVGSLNEIDPQHIRRLFEDPNPKHWPNLILTSSHARVADHTDVSEPMEGFRSLLRHSFNEASQGTPTLDLIRFPEDAASLDPSHKSTIMVSAVDNDHNNIVNGGKLVARLQQLKRIHHLQKQQPALSQAELEDEFVQGNKLVADALKQEIDTDIDKNTLQPLLTNKHVLEDIQGAISPAAVKLAKLMLSLIVEDPEQIYASKDAIISPERPFILREDADKVMQHIKLMGYSRGGNIVTDAERLLIMQLEHEGAVQTHDHKPMTVKDINHIMQHTGILCVNPGIYPLSQKEQALGMRRITIRNNIDQISSHFFAEFDEHYPNGTPSHDTVYVVNGTAKAHGHDIQDALGNDKHNGYIIDESHANPKDRAQLRHFRSHIQAFFAACHDKVGISHIYVDPMHPDHVDLQFSAGVSEENIRANHETIKHAFNGTHTPHIEKKEKNHRIVYRISTVPKHNYTQEEISHSLNQLSENGIYVSLAVYDEVAHQLPHHTPKPNTAHGGTAMSVTQQRAK